jgi:hypothetical protein
MRSIFDVVLLSIIMQSVFMLSVVMQIILMLNVILLTAVAPHNQGRIYNSPILQVKQAVTDNDSD